jgi:hypothetical protein
VSSVNGGTDVGDLYSRSLPVNGGHVTAPNGVVNFLDDGEVVLLAHGSAPLAGSDGVPSPGRYAQQALAKASKTDLRVPTSLSAMVRNTKVQQPYRTRPMVCDR